MTAIKNAQTKPHTSLPWVDLTALENLLVIGGGKPQLIIDLAKLFVATGESEITLMKQRHRDKNTHEVSELAHKLSSSCKSLGLLRMADICENIEAHFTTNAEQIQTQILAELESCYHQSTQELRRVIREVCHVDIP